MIENIISSEQLAKLKVVLAHSSNDLYISSASKLNDTAADTEAAASDKNDRFRFLRQ